MEKERWKYVVGYKNIYAVSTHGRVFSLRKKLFLKPRPNKFRRKNPRASDKYPFVELSSGGIEKRYPVHKLVLTAFRGPRQEGQECRHLDGNVENNHLSNLKWGSYWENRGDWHKHRKKIKLTPELVRYIRSSTKSLRALAAELGCAKSTVQYARGGYWVNSLEKLDL
jgi:hypothetical protein